MKPFTWEEIKLVLEEELKKTKAIMTFGTIGSCNVEHDIDLIITKKPKSKSSDFYKEIHNLFYNLDKYLNKKYNAKSICFFGCQPETLKLSNFTEKDLAIYRFIYTSFPQISKDWAWALVPDENIKSILRENYICLLGQTNDLFSKEFQANLYYDCVFNYINLYDRINSNYLDKFLIKVMSYYINFLYKKKLKLKAPIIKTEKDVKKYFYELCDIVDNLNKSFVKK